MNLWSALKRIRFETHVDQFSLAGGATFEADRFRVATRKRQGRQHGATRSRLCWVRMIACEPVGTEQGRFNPCCCCCDNFVNLKGALDNVARLPARIAGAATCNRSSVMKGKRLRRVNSKDQLMHLFNILRIFTLGIFTAVKYKILKVLQQA